jgi:hypothetical protein
MGTPLAYTIVSTSSRKHTPYFENHIVDSLANVAKEAARIRNMGYPCKVIDPHGATVA